MVSMALVQSLKNELTHVKVTTDASSSAVIVEGKAISLPTTYAPDTFAQFGALAPGLQTAIINQIKEKVLEMYPVKKAEKVVVEVKTVSEPVKEVIEPKAPVEEPPQETIVESVVEETVEITEEPTEDSQPVLEGHSTKKRKTK